MSAGWLYGVGSNQFFQLGTGANTGIKYELTAIADSNGNTEREWKYIHAGDRHSFAIKTDGTLWAWGSNDHGQLGFGDTTARNVPTKVGTDTDWKKVVACGVNEYGFSLGIKENGDLYVWGYNASGQLGLGDTNTRNIPTKLGDYKWTDVAGGDYHSVASKYENYVGNTIWAWGKNDFSQLGSPNSSKSFDRTNSLIPRRIADSNYDNNSYITHALLEVQYVGGNNLMHIDGILTEKHKLKVNVENLYGNNPAYVEIFTVYDGYNDGTYKKWKAKGWERKLKVICIGAGGGGGSAPEEKFLHMTSAGGGGGGGAIAMAEFLASPMRVSGAQDNAAVFYGIPKEVDIYVGIGGYSSKAIQVNDRIIELQNELVQIAKVYQDEIDIKRPMIRELLIEMQKLPKDNYGVPIETPEFLALRDERNAIIGRVAELEGLIYQLSITSPQILEIQSIQTELAKLGTNGVNGGFSRFGEYLIAAGGDGGKGGKSVRVDVYYDKFLENLKFSKDNILARQKTISELLSSDGGKGGGKEIILKSMDTIRGKYKLYPFKASNTPNSGLSSTYLPGGNGGMGSLGYNNTSGLTTLTTFVNIYNEWVASNSPNLQYEIAYMGEAILSYLVVNGNPDYDQNGESVFYSCTGGGGGFGLGGSIFGTKYSNEFGTDYKTVAAMLPQSLKSGMDVNLLEVKDYINQITQQPVVVKRTNVNGAGFKMGLGGDGGSIESVRVDSVYSTVVEPQIDFYPQFQVRRNGGFPGGGGGGGTPSSDVWNNSWNSNIRGGGDGADGVVIVIGM
jgi:hypothetical protein